MFDAKSLLLSDSSISDVSALNGGAIKAIGSNLTIIRSTFSKCKAYTSGVIMAGETS